MQDACTSQPNSPLLDGQVIAKPRRSPFRKIGFVLLNCWLVFHLAAIIVSPLSVEPAAPIAQNAWRVTGPYAQLAYLNHGYHFLCPQSWWLDDS